MDVASLDTCAISAQALDRLAMTGEITRRQRRDLDVAIVNLDRMLAKRSSKIIRQKYMTDMYDDCSQACQMGILSAVRTFDPSKGSFSTHVHNQLRAAVGDLKHKMKPETRNVQTIAPVQHVSLSTPVGSDESDRTVADLIEDKWAHADMVGRLEVSMVHLQIDRAYSHYLARSEGRHVGRLASPCGLREHRINKLREREVFVRYFLHNETLEVIASSYGITRERVRQIAAKIYTENASMDVDAENGEKRKEPGALNRYLVASHVSDECPTGYHDIWDEYVALAWAESARDIRLSPTALDLSTLPVPVKAIEFHAADVIGILPVASDDGVEVRIEDISDEDDAPMSMQGELPLFASPSTSGSRGMRRLMGMAAGLVLASSMATAAAAQTSRAIPPEDYEAVAPRVESASRPQRHAPRARPARTAIRVLDAGRLKFSTQAYGVLVASYPNVRTLMVAWPKARSEWSMLQGLHPAGITTRAGRYGLMFGPITKQQAFGVCHEAKRRPRECVVARFGGVRAPAGRPDRQVASTRQASRTSG